MKVFLVATVLMISPLLVCGQKSKVQPLPVIEYCSLFDSSKVGPDTKFSSRALMFYSNISRVDGADSFFYSAGCNSGDYFAVMESANSKIWNRWNSFFHNLKREQNFVLEVEFEGTLTTADDFLFGHLGWARTQINLSRIIAIRDVTALPTAVQSNSDAPTPLADQIKELHQKVIDFLPTLLFLNLRPDRYSATMLPTFVFVDGHGRSLTKAEYLTRKTPEVMNWRDIGMQGYSHTFVSRSGPSIIERGKVEFDFKDGTKSVLLCDMEFQLIDGHWMLSRAEMKRG